MKEGKNQDGTRPKSGTMGSSLKTSPEVEEKKECKEVGSLDEFESYSTASLHNGNLSFQSKVGLLFTIQLARKF